MFYRVSNSSRSGLLTKLSGVATQVLLGNGTFGVVPGVGTWSTWTPTRTGWTDVGEPTVTARKCQIGNIGYLQIKVVPSTTTATVAGTSYVDLPYTANASGIGGDGSMLNSTTLIGIGTTVIDVANSRIYVPTQGATANTLTISAWFEV